MTSWTDVFGWLTEEEGQLLQDLAAHGRVLELGSFCGRSTACMAQYARSLTSIDRHIGDSWTGPVDTYDVLLGVIQAFGLRNVLPLKGEIAELGKALPDNWFDLVYIDAGHEYPDALHDTKLALRVVKPGGIIAWHDWNFEGVSRAAETVGLRPAAGLPTLAWAKIDP